MAAYFSATGAGRRRKIAPYKIGFHSRGGRSTIRLSVSISVSQLRTAGVLAAAGVPRLHKTTPVCATAVGRVIEKLEETLEI